MNSLRKTVPIIFGILILTSLSGFQFAPMTVQTVEAEHKRIVGYFPYWESGDMSEIDYSQLTDIIYFHIWPNSEGVLDTSAVNATQLHQIRDDAHAEGVKVLIAVGGWGVSDGFPSMAEDDDARANFVSNVKEYLIVNDLDGVDIDWETTLNQEKIDNQDILLSDLYNTLHPMAKLVTVAANGDALELKASAANSVDWVNVMAYDMNWGNAEHSTFDDSVAALVRYEIEGGIPKEKLALGIPFYGRNDQTGALKYEDFASMCYPLLASENTCDGYFFNGIDLVKQKSQFVLESGYDGVMIWNLGQDTYTDTSLLNAINDVIGKSTLPPDNPEANPDSYSVQSQNTLNVSAPGVLLNDFDPEGDTLTAELVSPQSNGNLSLNSDGSFTYAPNSNFLGTDFFTYQVRDVEDNVSNVATVSIQVNTTPSAIEETSFGFLDKKAVTSVSTRDSFSGVADNLYITSISVNPAIDVQSVTGMSLDWKHLRSQCGSMGGSQTEVWYAIGNETTSSGVITAHLDSAAKSMVVSSSRISGINPHLPFGTIITGNNNEDSLCENGSPSTGYYFPIDIQNNNSMLFGAIGASQEQNGYQHTPGAGFSEVFHWVTKFNDVGLSVVQKPDVSMSTVSLDGTFSEPRDWHVIGIEIKPKGLGSTTNNPPTAIVNGPYSGVEDSLIEFDAIGSSDPDEDSLTYSWDFGDGSTGSGPTPTHAYGWGGIFTVALTAIDGRGGSDTAESIVTIIEVNDVPTADVGGPYFGIVNEAITFDGEGSFDADNQDGTTSNDPTLVYSWDFGDTLTGTGVITTHSFTSTGVFTVSLTVSDGESSDISETTVTVNEISDISIIGIEPDSVAKSESVDITISGSGFLPEASVTLTNGNGAPPRVSNVFVASDGKSITVTITANGSGPPTNPWDVTVTNLDLSSDTKDGGFTVTRN